jgi:1,2-diacylglycerol 3-alpha-glucosyltransferase
MRIGFFTDTYTPQINGVVTSITLFAKALERLGHTVYIFAPTPRQRDDGQHIIRIPSVPFAFQPEMRLASLYSAHADRLVRRANLDIIHSHDPFAIGLYGLAVAKRYRLPYVHTYHTLYPEYVHYIWETRFTRAMAERLSREFCDQCDLVLAPSTKIERALHRWGVTSPVTTLPTGVDAGRFAARDEEAIAAFRHRFGIPEDDKLLVFVGRIGKEKNVDALLEAMVDVKTPGARLVIVGDGPHRAALEKRMRALHVADRVTLTGYVRHEEVAAAYQAGSALFFASKSETQGLVIAEAMAAGLPVVAVNDLAVADAVADGVNGYLVKDAPAALAEAADRLLGDDATRERMAAASVERAEDICIDNQAARLVGLYEQALAAKGPRRRRLGQAAAVVRVRRQMRSLQRQGRSIVRRYL